MSDALLKNTFNKISPAYELVADVTVGTATTQVDFSGLNFGKDDDLLLVGDWVNGVASTSYLSLFLNGNTTETNYYYEILQANGTSVVSGRANGNVVTEASASLKTFFESNLKLTNNGYFISQNESSRNYGSGVILESIYDTSTFTSTNITKLSIVSNVSNAIGIGSRFQLYRLKAKKVADIIVSTATTQVDITGLSIDKDSEYMLVSDVVNASGTTDLIALYPNDNVTSTNYYNQNIYATGVDIASSRTNTNYCFAVYTGYKNFAITKIKLTNNGYFVYQSDTIPRYYGTNMFLSKNYGTSTFTMTSISKLSIKANITNAIGIGSRFTLYKMK